MQALFFHSTYDLKELNILDTPTFRRRFAGAIIFTLMVLAIAYAFSSKSDPLASSTHVLQQDGPKPGIDGIDPCQVVTRAQAEAITGLSLTQYGALPAVTSDYSARACSYLALGRGEAVGNGLSGDTRGMTIETQIEPDATHPAFSQLETETQTAVNESYVPINPSLQAELHGAASAFYIFKGATTDYASAIVFTTSSRVTVQIWAKPGSQANLLLAAKTALNNLS